MVHGFTNGDVITVRNLAVILAVTCTVFGCSMASGEDHTAEATTQAAPAPKTIGSMECKELDDKMASEYRRVAEIEASMPKAPPQGKTVADMKKMNAESKTLYADPLIKEYSEAQKEYKTRCKGEPTATKVAKKQNRTTYIR